MLKWNKGKTYTWIEITLPFWQILQKSAFGIAKLEEIHQLSDNYLTKLHAVCKVFLLNSVQKLNRTHNFKRQKNAIKELMALLFVFYR